jgi:hypothetical protein
MRAIVGLLTMLVSSTALANPQCTNTPVERWISADEMKSKIVEASYKIDVFKITKGNCYEIYGRNKEGKRVEVYFDPTTGKAVRESVRQ